MNTGTPNAEERRRVAAEQAAAWLVALREDRLSAHERGEFVDWLRESPVHVAEMLRISQLDQALAEFGDWTALPAATPTPDNVVQLLPGPSRPAARRPRFAGLTRAIAAGLAIVVVAGGGWLALREQGTVVRTQLAERREMILADGSAVSIAPLSEMRIRYTADRRSIELRKGHAHFDVTHDARRPFVVDAGTATVQAVGTSFDVERAPGSVRVTVVEGRVAVTQQEKGATGSVPSPATVPARVMLGANEEIVVPSQAPMTAVVHQVNAPAQAAWTTGSLVFEDETVAEVVRRFNLHNQAQIRILDPELAARRISGTFRASDPESFIAFIHATSASPAGDRSVILVEPHSR